MPAAWEEQTITALKANDVELIAYLPDGALADLLTRVKRDDAFTTVSVEREEAGVGVVSGAWLGHTRGALLCQSSGLATTINALASLSKPARIPFVGLVTQRGGLGEFNLAQVPFGYNLEAVLDTMGFRNETLATPENAETTTDLAAKTAFATKEPFFLVLPAMLTGAKDEF